MLILLPLLSAFVSTPALDDAPFQLWAADPLVKIFPDTLPTETMSIEISCARNEYQSGQFAITAGRQLENVTVELGELTHESGYSY